MPCDLIHEVKSIHRNAKMPRKTTALEEVQLISCSIELDFALPIAVKNNCLIQHVLKE
jgi:hypothetical protein